MAYIFIFVALTGIYFLYLLLIEAIKLKNKQAKNFIFYLSLLILSFLIELYNFYKGSFEYTSMFGRVGISLFLAFIFKNNIKEINKLMLMEKEKEFMERLVYTDVLTGGYNRSRFEKDFDDLLDKKKIPKFRVVSMDINNLKYVNDNFGHQEGDNMIKLAYKLIVDVFGTDAKNYRLGGDEFISILENSDQETFSNKLDELHKRLHVLSNELDYNFMIATGSDIYSDEIYENKDIFLNHIDQLMYENKKFLKGL